MSQHFKNRQTCTLCPGTPSTYFAFSFIGTRLFTKWIVDHVCCSVDWQLMAFSCNLINDFVNNCVVFKARKICSTKQEKQLERFLRPEFVIIYQFLQSSKNLVHLIKNILFLARPTIALLLPLYEDMQIAENSCKICETWISGYNVNYSSFEG